MKIRLIMLLLWILAWMSFFLKEQHDKSVAFSLETNRINEKVMIEQAKISEMNRNSKINEVKWEILKNISSSKSTKKLIITDRFLSYENLYNAALSSTWFYEKTKKKDFVSSIEFKNLEELKKNLLTSRIIFGWNNSETIIWIPKSVDCKNIKSPCQKSDKYSDITFSENETFIIWENRTFTANEALDILSGKTQY